jgi:hypothetical protein
LEFGIDLKHLKEPKKAVNTSEGTNNCIVRFWIFCKPYKRVLRQSAIICGFLLTDERSKQ